MPNIDEVFLFPSPLIERRPEHAGLPAYRELSWPNEAGHVLHAWWIEPTDPSGSPVSAMGAASVAWVPRAEVILSHGNAGNIGRFLDWAGVFAGLGCRVLLYDYQGFGRSRGRPEIAALPGDLRSAMAKLRELVPGVAGREVLAGLSLGTVVSIAAAATVDPEPAALILEGAFDPAVEIPRMFGPLGAVIGDMLARQVPGTIVPDRQLAGLAMPMLFLQAVDDKVTTTPGAERLRGLAGGPTEWVEFGGGAGHLEPVFADVTGYRAAVDGFLTRAGFPRSPGHER